jgi:hypothetical protein
LKIRFDTGLGTEDDLNCNKKNSLLVLQELLSDAEIQRPDKSDEISEIEEVLEDVGKEQQYICNFCHRTLSRLSDHSGNESFYCNFCSIETLAEESRSKSKLTVPNRIEEPAVTLLPEVGLKRKNKEPKERGIKITDYKERGWRKQNDE